MTTTQDAISCLKAAQLAFTRAGLPHYADEVRKLILYAQPSEDRLLDMHPAKPHAKPLITEHAFFDPYEADECHVVVDEADEGVTRCRKSREEHDRETSDEREAYGI